MKFRDLTERYYKTIEALPQKFSYAKSGAVEVFLNPSLSEVMKIQKNSEGKGVRFGLMYRKKYELFAWDGDFIHPQIEKDLKKYFDFAYYYDSSSRTKVFSDTHTLQDWEDLHIGYPDVVEKIKKSLPSSVGEIELVGGTEYL